MKLVLVVLVLILIVLQLRLWTGSGSLEDINRLEQRIAEQEAENAELLLRNEALRREVQDLKTGQDSIEERARSELGLIKQGETFYMIVDEAKEDAGNSRQQLAAPFPAIEGSSPTAEGSSPSAEGSSPTAEGSSPTAEGSSPPADDSEDQSRTFEEGR